MDTAEEIALPAGRNAEVVNVPSDELGGPTSEQDPVPAVLEFIESPSDDEFDKQQFGIYQCLPIDNLPPNFESGEAGTVEEYMRRVR
jgi:hypothetical protein